MRRVLYILTAALLILTMAAGCSGKSGKLTKITLNEVTHSVFYAPQYAAIYLGYFKDEGLDIELVNGGGSDKTMTALISGDADFGLLGAEAAIYVKDGQYNDPPVIVGQP